MIAAAEALQLATAQLTPEEVADVNKLEEKIDAHVRLTMGRNGTDFKFDGDPSPKVLAEVNVRIKQAGFNTQWEQIGEPNRFNKAAPPRIIGYVIHMSPNDESYRTAARASLS